MSIPPYSYIVSDQISAGDYPGKQHPKFFWRIFVSKFYEILAFIKHPSKGYFGPTKRLNTLIEAGTNSFIDLTEEEELPPYSHSIKLINSNSKLSKTIKYKRIPIKDLSTPAKNEMEEILNYIDQEITTGNKIYIHCLRGLGRTGIVVGCYFVRHGYTGKEAINKIASLRKDLPNNWLQSPQTKTQKEFVINWGK
ncbi:MAG: hypothetical protein FI687_04115 [SAR202 cluster bacterium]|nr:hypothetical protein [SAR202 cluster bacterium]|tara:strand:- start:24061 stop:24645 length:585 start_codon:yes stop_codon:yes gene_type:complete